MSEHRFFAILIGLTLIWILSVSGVISGYTSDAVESSPPEASTALQEQDQ